MSMSEHTLVELKAKVSNLKPVRDKLSALKVKCVGKVQQTDIYFEVPRGRLKLRQINNETTQLIYYERQNISRPKRSDVFIIEIIWSNALLALLKRILKAKATVKKTREIYQHQRTRIHLDTVDLLGCYIEFERETANTTEEIERNENILKKLVETLEIDPANLEKLSYSDLVNLK